MTLLLLKSGRHGGVRVDFSGHAVLFVQIFGLGYDGDVRTHECYDNDAVGSEYERYAVPEAGGTAAEFELLGAWEVHGVRFGDAEYWAGNWDCVVHFQAFHLGVDLAGYYEKGCEMRRKKVR